MAKQINVAFFADINDNHNQKWLEQLVKKINIIVITLENNGLKNNFQFGNASIKVYPILPNRYSIRSLLKFNRTKRKIKSILIEHDVQIIHSIYSSPYSLWADIFQKNNHIITTYGSDVLVDYKNTWANPKNAKQLFSFNFLRKKTENAFNRARIITSTSASQQDVIKQFISNEDKLYITRTGVNCDVFLEHSFITKTGKENFIILSNRAMRPLYNIDIIVDAFLIFMREAALKNCKLILLNYNTDPKYYDQIIEKIDREHAHNYIEIQNDLKFDDLISLYKTINLAVMIPRSDGTPVSGVEALLAKTPLVMGNLKYDTDLFNDNTTWFINRISARDLSEKFIELYNSNGLELERKAENGYNTAIKNANLELEIKKILGFYERILSTDE